MSARHVLVCLPPDIPTWPFSLGHCRPLVHTSQHPAPFYIPVESSVVGVEWPGQALGRHRKENIFLFLSIIIFSFLPFSFLSFHCHLTAL